jgi:hypothetical protein
VIPEKNPAPYFLTNRMVMSPGEKICSSITCMNFPALFTILRLAILPELLSNQDGAIKSKLL